MHILFINPWKCACGICTYSENLIEQLEKQGVKVEVFSDTKNFTALSKLAKDVPDGVVVHIQHEFGISLPTEALLSLIGKFKSAGKPVVITTHTESQMFNILLDGVADIIILHNDADNMSTRPTFTKFYKIPHGIPEVKLEDSVSYLRRKYEIPEKAFVIGTCGFLSPDRGQFLENTIQKLLEFVKANPSVFFHIVTSKHRGDADGNFASLVHSTLTKYAELNGFQNRFIMTKDFMPTQEFRERLSTLSVGIVMAPPQVASNSGAAADLISCGVPVVANCAKHFSHIANYCAIVPTVEDIPNKVIELYNDRPQLETLVAKTHLAVADLGYSVVAKKHIEIYESLKNSGSVKPNTFSGKASTVLSTDTPITVTCPNSLWQTLIMWQKLYPLVQKGHKIRFCVQNDGLTDLTVLKFALDGVKDIVFTDVGMGRDKHLVRIFSHSIAQNMVMDVERWIEDGNSVHNLLGINEAPSGSYSIKLGEFAVNRAKKIMQQSSDYPLVVNVANKDMADRVEYWLRMMENMNIIIPSIILIGSPLQQDAVNDLYNRLAVTLDHHYQVAKAIEDIRTRWALCGKAAAVLTPWDDIGVFCLLGGITTFYDTDQEWQRALIKELNTNKESCVFDRAHMLSDSVEKTGV